MAETDGYWGEGYYGSGYWGEGYWGVAAAAAPTAVGNKWIGGMAVLKKKPSRALLLAAKQFFEAELAE